MNDNNTPIGTDLPVHIGRMNQKTQPSEIPAELTEAYDIKNVDFRNLLTVVMGTVSNQTGETFDKAMLRSKCADEILRRFNELEARHHDLNAEFIGKQLEVDDVRFQTKEEFVPLIRAAKLATVELKLLGKNEVAEKVLEELSDLGADLEVYEMDNENEDVYSYLFRKFGVIHSDETLKELPVNSECGRDCKRAIDKAYAFKLASEPSTHFLIQSALCDTVQIFWRG